MKKVIWGLTVIIAFIFSGCADAGTDQAVESGSKVQLDGSKSTGIFGSKIKRYIWKQIKGKRVQLSDKNSPKPTFMAPSFEKDTKLVFKLTTKDTKGFRSSSKVTITVKQKPEVINGYTLPPEPDPKINNSTLLGVDSNDNGIRDDVERYVIKRFAKDPKYPKTKTAIALQYAWAEQKIIENPTMDSYIYGSKAIACKYYWFSKINKDLNEKLMNLGNSSDDFQKSIKLSLEATKRTLRHKIYDAQLKDKIFNTKERIKRSFMMNEALSGHILKGQPNTIDSCQTDIDKLGE